MESSPLYNSRVIITFLEYLKNNHPDVDIEDILSLSGISSYELEDEGHWLTQQQVDRFHDALMEKTHDSSIFREAGRYMYSSNSIKAIRQFILGFLSPIQAYKMLGKIASYLNRGTTFKVNKVGLNSVEIITSLNKGVIEQPYQCENRIGSLEALVQIFTGKLPTVEHPNCMHKGDLHCRYLINWREPNFVIWRRIRNYAAISLIMVIAVCAIFISPEKFAVSVSLLATVIIGLSFYAQYLEKKDFNEKIKMQGDAANRLLDQITNGYNNALLVQEIGQAVSSILDIDLLLKFVMETLHKRLNFDRALIMLANQDRSRLVYVSGYGFSADLESLLLETEFHLDNPNSKGPFVISYKEQKPILINDISEIKNNISIRSRDFVEVMGVISFICVPIIYEGKSEGILCVDNYCSHRPHSQSEVSLLMGIAPQIAISINNAKAHQQVSESEEKFRNLSENSPDLIYTTDSEGRITYVNPIAEEILGYSISEMTGHYLEEFAKSNELDTFRNLFKILNQNKKSVKNLKASLLTKDEKEKIFYLSGAPNFNAMGELTGMVGVLKDITEQQKMERQLRHVSRMNAIGRLTGGISHDFNNLLHAISAYNELLTIRKDGNDPDWKYLMNIKDLTKRATNLVRQLLLFSRKNESKFQPININIEIKNFHELLINTLPKMIDLQIDLAKGLFLVNGDASQFGQVIMNLVVNAKDAMPEGGMLKIKTRSVDVTATQHRNGKKVVKGRYILITISDNGTGISKENLDHIFEPYFTTKDVGKGTGIGLSVVYGIIKNHQGFIFCNSEPGRGTDFEIYLPALDIEIIEEKSVSEQKNLPEGKETVLLVDDEASILEVGKELLAMLGYNVLIANSGEAALEVISKEKGHIALTILDLMMPGMGGEKCVPEIQKIDPSMKIIISSGFIGLKKQEIFDSRTVDFIQKPYHIEILSNKIRSLLNQNVVSS